MTQRLFSRKKSTLFSLFGVILMVSQVGVSTSYALNQVDYPSQNIQLFRKDDTLCQGSSSGSVNPVGNDTAEKIFNFLTSTPIRTNNNKPLNAVQASAFIGNFMKESTEKLDPGITNSIGAYGLVQWLGGRKDALFALAAQQSKQPSDLSVQLDFIKQEIEGGESAAVIDATFQAGTDIDAVTVVVRKKYERPGEQEADDPTRIAYAKGIHAKYKDSAPSTGGSSSSTSGGCLGSGIHQGDLIKTALGLAWDKPVSEGTALKKDARPEYVAAMAKYSNITNDSDAISPFSDCGRFVANVMRSSGLDPDYHLVGTLDQLAYVKSKSSLYTVIKNPSFSDFKAGDIMISTTHTAIYTGDSSYDTVDASLGGRVPAVSNGMSYYVTSNSDVHLVRYIGEGVKE